MALIIEVLVDQKDLLGGWSEIYAGSDGQPRYRSNNQLVGAGTRVTRVRNTEDANTAPSIIETKISLDLGGRK